MKELLNEFAERETCTKIMLQVLETIDDIEMDLRVIRIYRKREEFSYVLAHKKELKQDFIELQKVLKAFALDYEAKELLDSEVLKELEDEL